MEMSHRSKPPDCSRSGWLTSMPIDWIQARRGKILRRALPKSSGDGIRSDGLLAPNGFWENVGAQVETQRFPDQGSGVQNSIFAAYLGEYRAARGRGEGPGLIAVARMSADWRASILDGTATRKAEWLSTGLPISRPTTRARRSAASGCSSRTRRAIPIPLAEGDPDFPLDLQASLTTTCDRAGCDYSLDYSADVRPAPSAEDTPWLKSQLAT